jgi:hypothetical protein
MPRVWPLALVMLLGLPGCIEGGSVSAEQAEANLYAHGLPAALVWSRPFPELLVEIDHAPGRAPSSLALDALADTLREVTAKQRVTLLPPTPLPSEARFASDHGWRLPELQALREAFFDARPRTGHGEGASARLHVYYLNGWYAGEGGESMGVFVTDAVFVFPDAMQGHPPVAGLPRRPLAEYLERHTLVHEVGHAMGLVDNGIPMVRPHVAEDGSHSVNPRSVMSGIDAWTGNLDAVQDNAWAPYRFDEDDLADLAAFRALGERWTPYGR